MTLMAGSDIDDNLWHWPTLMKLLRLCGIERTLCASRTPAITNQERCMTFMLRGESADTVTVLEQYSGCSVLVLDRYNAGIMPAMCSTG